LAYELLALWRLGTQGDHFLPKSNYRHMKRGSPSFVYAIWFIFTRRRWSTWWSLVNDRMLNLRYSSHYGKEKIGCDAKIDFSLEFVLFNLTECIFVFRTVIDFLFSKLWNFPLFFGGKIQSLLYKKSMTVLKTKIHSVRLKIKRTLAGFGNWMYYYVFEVDRNFYLWEERCPKICKVSLKIRFCAKNCALGLVESVFPTLKIWLFSKIRLWLFKNSITFFIFKIHFDIKWVELATLGQIK